MSAGEVKAALTPDQQAAFDAWYEALPRYSWADIPTPHDARVAGFQAGWVSRGAHDAGRAQPTEERVKRAGEWVLVPREPTEDQLKAANRAALSTSVLTDDTRFACERATYYAALAAAPPAPEPSDEVVEKMARAYAIYVFGEQCVPADADLTLERNALRTALAAQRGV